MDDEQLAVTVVAALLVLIPAAVKSGPPGPFTGFARTTLAVFVGIVVGSMALRVLL